MTIVADSGSTKTTWALVETGNNVVTEGLNPHFSTDEQILTACQVVRQQFSIFNSQFSLYFYGSGCGDLSQNQRMRQLLRDGFGDVDVHVETDMLGACRAVCGNKAGFVGILGTGSNACYYDGTAITCQPFSTGFILGDHGSANHVGRILLNDYLVGRMPQHLRDLFHDVYKLSNSQFIENVYRLPNANRFLASLAPFAVGHLDDDYCAKVINKALNDWYSDPFLPLFRRAGSGEAVLNFVGGFAKAIEPTLRIFFSDSGIQICSVIADPISSLVSFHSS